MSAFPVIPYLRPIAVTSNGCLAGLGLTITVAAIPVLRSTGYPVKGWMALYDRGSKIAMSTIAVSFLSQSAIYYFTKDTRALFCTMLTASIPLWTGLFMKRINDRLMQLNGGAQMAHAGEGKQLIEKWARCQYFRTAAGALAFLLSVF
ncbi:hypothetical protein BX666DRAFT_2003315 [Dichotomocladium elegans]|nr:hypothetical protein BX666DRAFT_2003315 [Dichotomocladium elegans]